MDQMKFDYFCARYRNLEIEDLVQLHGRRDTLTDEAISALDTVFVEKGINVNVLEHYSKKAEVPSKSEGKIGVGRMIAHTIAAIVVIFISNVIARMTPHWVGLLMMVGLLGYGVFWLLKKKRKAN